MKKSRNSHKPNGNISNFQAIKQSVRAVTPVNSPEEPTNEEEGDRMDSHIITNEEPTIDDSQGDDNSRSEPEGSAEITTEMNGETLDSKSVEEENLSVDEWANGITKMKIEENEPVNTPKTLPPLKMPEGRPWSEGDNSVYSQVQVRHSV